MSSEATRTLKVILMGVDEFSPTLNRLNGSLTNTGRVVNSQMGSMAKSTGLLSEQFKILRRTAEYAVAGFALYKVYQAISAYKQFRSELGLLNANLLTTGKNLEAIGTSAIKTSIATAAPLNDIVQSYQNLAATFPGIKPSQLPAFAAIEAKASRIMQVQPQLAGSTISALGQQFYGQKALMGPKGESIINKIAQMLVKTQFTSTRTTGQDITSYIPMLAGGATTAGFDLSQMLSLFAVAQRQLGRPAQTAQYLRQLFIRLKSPTKSEQRYFNQAGLTPNILNNQSGNDTLQQLIKYGLGLQGSSMNYDQAKKAGFRGLTIKGEAADFFRKSIGGRIQSLVAINALVRNFGQIAVQQQSLVGESTKELDKRWQAWLDQNRMTQAAIAFNGMTVSMVNDLNPVIQGASLAGTKIAELGVKANTYAQKGAGVIGGAERGILKEFGIGGNFASRYHLGGITEVALAAAGIFGMKKAGVGGAIKKIPGYSKLFGKGSASFGETVAGRVLGGAIRGPLDLQALSSAMTGTANGTATAPFWVVIHPLSAQTVPGMFGGRKSQSTSTLIDDTFGKMAKVGVSGYAITKTGAAAAKKTGLARFLARFGPAAGMAGDSAFLKSLGPAGAATSFFMDAQNTGNMGRPGKGQAAISIGDYVRYIKKGSYLDLMLNPQSSGSGFRNQVKDQMNWMKLAWTRTPAMLRAETAFASGSMSESAFQKLLMTADPSGRHRNLSRATTGVTGSANVEATFWLQPTEELKNILKPQKVRASVPTKLHGVGSPAPTSRAQKAQARNNT